MEIIKFDNDNINPLIDKCFDFSLMAEDYMEKIESFFIAIDNNEDALGFLAQGYDGDCILIEVKEEFRMRGIGTALVKNANAFSPRQNGCPDFWDKVSNV
jgi:hypothetical protein